MESHNAKKVQLFLESLKKNKVISFLLDNLMHSFTISSEGINYIKSIISGQRFNKEKISKRELDEINERLNLDKN